MKDDYAGITCSRCGRALYAKDGPTCPECLKAIAAELVALGKQKGQSQPKADTSHNIVIAVDKTVDGIDVPKAK